MIKIKTIGQLLDYVETEEKALELIKYINQLQSNWNSLREWFKYGIEEYTTDDGFIQNILKQGLDKMNELESSDKN